MQKLLQNILPFHGLCQEEIEEVCLLLRGKEKIYSAKETILHQGDLTHCMGIVLSGKVLIQRFDYLGNMLILGQSGPLSLFGEVYAYLENVPLMVDVLAQVESKILWLDLRPLKEKHIEEKTWFPRIMKNLMTLSAKKNLALSQRSFHTQSKTIRGRVLSYLHDQAILKKKNCFLIPFNRQQLADYLGVNRSALSFELSKMKKEGLISYQKNLFTLHHGDVY